MQRAYGIVAQVRNNYSAGRILLVVAETQWYLKYNRIMLMTLVMTVKYEMCTSACSSLELSRVILHVSKSHLLGSSGFRDQLKYREIRLAKTDLPRMIVTNAAWLH